MKKLIELFIPHSVKEYLRITNNRISQLEQISSNNSQIINNLELVLNTAIQSPEFVNSPEIGFNGQKGRKEIFTDLLQLNFETIIETGTFIGNTTGYMQLISKLPIFTCELDNRFYVLAKSRLKQVSNISFYLSDSRSFLKQLANSDIKNKRAFFYLDAHWYNDLPLREEISIISENWKEFVIMVDDFQVPNDGGYGFDNYGQDKSLTMEHISDLVEQEKLSLYFPMMKSGMETGKKRGCVILAPSGKISDDINEIKSLVNG